MKHTVNFVSLGPGEPDLITVKGLKLLQQAEVIFCPATCMKGDSITSRAADIVKALDIQPEKICLFMLPMNRDREEAWQSYDDLCEKVNAAYAQGKQVVVVAEGDAGFYSSVQYVYDKLADCDVEVKRTPGIPAFIAAGAVAGFHIVKQEERLVVIPGIVSAADLEEKVEQNYVVVIMKLCAAQDSVRQCMVDHPEYTYHYFENVGTDKEFYTKDHQLLQARKFPYFSLMILHK